MSTSSVFVALSYFPILLILFILTFIYAVILSVWNYFFNKFLLVSICTLLLIFIIWIFIESSTDSARALNEFVNLIRTIQYCFLWFILSEAILFSSFFWGAFTLNLINTLEFNSLHALIPIEYSYAFTLNGMIFHWFYLDLFNIILNTGLLFFSGLFANMYLTSTLTSHLNIAFLNGILSAIMGFLFVWNQLWEFSLLTISISSNAFTTTLYSIDLLHFSHVNLGVLLLITSLIFIIDTHTSSIRNIFLLCIILYWHFVDLIWFILLRLLYFDLITSPYF